MSEVGVMVDEHEHAREEEDGREQVDGREASQVERVQKVGGD